MDNKDLREKRKEWFSQMEAKLKEMHTKEDDSLFYYHSSEDRIVLSHAMFWTMTQLQFFKSKLRKEKFFLLLRQYQEEMFDAFLQDDDYFPKTATLLQHPIWDASHDTDEYGIRNRQGCP